MNLNMKASIILSLGFCISLVIADIPVEYKVTLSCNESSPYYTGCLRGMTCIDGEVCVKPPVRAYALSYYNQAYAPRPLKGRIARTNIEGTPPAASAIQEPTLGSPSIALVTGPDTTDGNCGAGNGKTVCGNWPQGACCSLYGVYRSPSLLV